MLLRYVQYVLYAFTHHTLQEEFEARDDDSGDEYEGGQGFARADEDTLAKRKIVRVKRFVNCFILH